VGAGYSEVEIRAIDVGTSRDKAAGRQKIAVNRERELVSESRVLDSALHRLNNAYPSNIFNVYTRNVV